MTCHVTMDAWSWGLWHWDLKDYEVHHIPCQRGVWRAVWAWNLHPTCRVHQSYPSWIWFMRRLSANDVVGICWRIQWCGSCWSQTERYKTWGWIWAACGNLAWLELSPVQTQAEGSHVVWNFFAHEWSEPSIPQSNCNMQLDRRGLHRKSQPGSKILPWSCCVNKMYVKVPWVLPKPVSQDAEVQARFQVRKIAALTHCPLSFWMKHLKHLKHLKSGNH